MKSIRNLCGLLRQSGETIEILVRGQPQGSFRSTAGREVRVEVPLDESRGTPVEVRVARDGVDLDRGCQ